MNKRIALCLTAAAISITWAAGARAVNITACQTLSVPGAYVLQSDVNTCGGSCFIIAADGVTLDLNSHYVYQYCSDSGSAGVTDSGASRINTTIKNSGGGGVISLYDNGIDLAASTRNNVLGVNTNVNAQGGMKIGTHSLVKNCTVDGNGHVGITIDHYGQVQGCTVDGNGYDAGIKGRDHMLITQNTVINTNLGVGIVVGNFCTVSWNNSNFNGLGGIDTGDTCGVNYNTANNNGGGCPGCGVGIAAGSSNSVAGNTANNNQDQGMQVGQKSTVTNNTANGNGAPGIEVDCPSTVTNNHSNTGYSFPGAGCFLKNNL